MDMTKESTTSVCLGDELPKQGSNRVKILFPAMVRHCTTKKIDNKSIYSQIKEAL
jgi:hypothetical protein